MTGKAGRSDGPAKPSTTAWRLRNPFGRQSRCLISDRDVIVWSGPGIVFWDRRPTPEAAAALADELWTILVARGWVRADADPNHALADLPTPYRRTCPECQEPRAATITHRRGYFVVLRCEACGIVWNDRERTAVGDRRFRPRPEMDRRQAA